jgi:hypothetical protein
MKSVWWLRNCVVFFCFETAVCGVKNQEYPEQRKCWNSRCQAGLGEIHQNRSLVFCILIAGRIKYPKFSLDIIFDHKIEVSFKFLELEPKFRNLAMVMDNHSQRAKNGRWFQITESLQVLVVLLASSTGTHTGGTTVLVLVLILVPVLVLVLVRAIVVLVLPAAVKLVLPLLLGGTSYWNCHVDVSCATNDLRVAWLETALKNEFARYLSWASHAAAAPTKTLKY